MGFPLLGNDREIQGGFHVETEIAYKEIDNELKWIFRHKNNEVQVSNQLFNELIEQGLVELHTSILCRSTLFSDSFKSGSRAIVDQNKIGDIIEISSVMVAAKEFEIDLSNQETVNTFFRKKHTVIKGSYLSTVERTSHYIPIEFKGESNNLFVVTESTDDQIHVNLNEDDKHAARVILSYPTKLFQEFQLYYSQRKKDQELNLMIFFQNHLLEMLYKIYEKYEKYNSESEDDDLEFYENLNPWMQELMKSYELLNTPIIDLKEYSKRLQLINNKRSGEFPLVKAINQINNLMDHE